MNIHEALAEIEQITQNVIDEMVAVNAEDLGLDPRSAYRKLYVSRDCIAVRKEEDRTLQYYGGFEYVEKDCRFEMGDYVFYTIEDDRVEGHVSEYFDSNDEENEDDDV